MIDEQTVMKSLLHVWSGVRRRFRVLKMAFVSCLREDKAFGGQCFGSGCGGWHIWGWRQRVAWVSYGQHTVTVRCESCKRVIDEDVSGHRQAWQCDRLTLWSSFMKSRARGTPAFSDDVRCQMMLPCKCSLTRKQRGSSSCSSETD